MEQKGKIVMDKREKIAVLFPGIGYTCEKPLLYYGAKLAAENGFEIVRVPYGNFPPNVKGDEDKMVQCFVSAREQSEKILGDVEWERYSEIVFFSKSVGTVVALSYAEDHGLNAMQVLFTPLEETFRFPTSEGGAIAFHGTGDPWARTEEIVRLCEEREIPLYLTPEANHSLECGKVKKDIKTVRKVMKAVEEFLQSEEN